MKMKTMKQYLPVVFIVVCLLAGISAPLFKGPAEAAAPRLADRAAQYIGSEYTNNGVINADMGVGAQTFYILDRAGIDFSAWRHDGAGLKDAMLGAIKNDLANNSQVPAKRLAQDLAAARALGQENLAEQLLQQLKNRQGSEGFDDLGPLSVYSNVPAYEILSRLGLLGRLDTVLARDYILGTQYAGVEEKYFGSWGSVDNGKFYADFIAATEAVRLLHRMNPGGSDPEIQAAINSGLTWIKKQQKDSGNFVAGMDDTLIDTCDVIVTLKELGMDPAAWVSGEGRSAFDYLVNEALNADGSFGQSQNVMDAVWVLWACTALEKAAALTQAQTVQQPPAVPEQPTPPVQPVTLVQPAATVFADTKGHWAENAIYRLAERGITTGYADGTFKPEAQVTRYEIAAMMVRLLHPELASVLDRQAVREKFADSGSIPQWALDPAAAALKEGLVSGYPQPDGSMSFEGGRQVSRAELAVMMARVIEKRLGQVEPGSLDFTDKNLIPAWAGKAVGIIYSRGIAGGYPDGTFRAENPVTRAEAASMLVRLAEQIENK
jgi:hypothetical protein